MKFIHGRVITRFQRDPCLQSLPYPSWFMDKDSKQLKVLLILQLFLYAQALSGSIELSGMISYRIRLNFADFLCNCLKLNKSCSSLRTFERSLVERVNNLMALYKFTTIPLD